MTKYKKEIKDIYKLYGFEVLNEGYDYIVFQHNKGYFNNLEIVTFSKNDNCVELKAQYDHAGYSVNSKNFTSLDEIHEKLFSGFFRIKLSKKKIDDDYIQFCDLQTKKKITDGKYKYIDCNYTLNNESASSSLIDYVNEQIEKETANLIIIEAAAGFGKTCASYEIMHTMSSRFDKKIPLLAELSKNRKASIFRYVLLSEIDTNFTGLNYELVENEILNGRIPLIIDGFDELLSKSIDSQNSSNTEQFKESQTMLDTIAHFLLDGSKAKIILTSRKSSIFTGELFDSWIERRKINCEIDRIQLGAPNPSKWLGPTKSECVKRNMNELFSISNPILLDIINELDIDTLEKSTTDDIIQIYFKRLLNREKERQALMMTEEEQINTMRQLAGQFVEFNISSEEPKYIAEIIEMILGEHLDEYIDKYNEWSFLNEGAVPDRQEFIFKLVHHAFLDRVSVSKNNIGFINDFVFGLLIGDSLINHQLSIEKVSYKYLDITTTAFSLQSFTKRNELFKIIEPALNELDDNNRVYLESKILFHASMSYTLSTFTSIHFNKQFEFFPEYNFENCTFYDCVFDNCKISLNAFKECQFINCKFFDLEFVDESNIDNQLIFLSCAGHQKFSELASQYNPPIDEGKNYKKILLEQFWKIGKEKAEPRCGFHTVYRGISKTDIGYIDKALNELISIGLIKKLSCCYELNFSRIEEIKEILERM